jgi:hypothetical protein
VQDAEDVPFFARASQNIAAAAMILRSILKSNDPEARRIHRDLKGLMEHTAVQQAVSSTSQRHEASSASHSRCDTWGCKSPAPQMPCPRGAPPVMPWPPPVTPVRGCLGHDRDACLTIDARHRARDDQDRAYLSGGRNHGQRGGGRGHDQSPSLDAPWPRAFGRSILNAPFLPCFRALTHIPKYAGEMNPNVWLDCPAMMSLAGRPTAQQDTRQSNAAVRPL